MAIKSQVFSSKVKHRGIFNFADFYKFCYDWLNEEVGLDVAEKKYTEKIGGDSKEIEIEWDADRKLTDYFKFEVFLKIKIDGMKKVNVKQGEANVQLDSGSVEVELKGTLIRDYDAKFERSAWDKFLRGIYEKYIIASNIEATEEKIIMDCDIFLSQVKAYLDLEGKR